ncbi:protein TolA [Blochmannia endosymbiont of Camponotus (Colobopsis) obliquus]|nr:protein TolA [Blochmannia endosymbiont of Camponotus (Colobopsis) obliquus]
MVLKVIDTFSKHFKLFIVLSIVIHLLFIFIFNYNYFITSRIIDNNNTTQAISVVMLDFNKIADSNNLYLKTLDKQSIVAEKKEIKNINNSTYAQSKNMKQKINDINVVKKTITDKKKTKINLPKKSVEIDKLLNDLIDIKNTQKLNHVNEKNNFINDSLKRKLNSITHNDMLKYKQEITRSISDKFYDYSKYIGQTCDLHIKIAPDGKLVSVTSSKGDRELCQAAISATKLAIIPPPPNHQIYTLFQETIVNFTPQ